MNPIRHFTRLVLAAGFAAMVSAQVPQLINYQGRVAVGTVNFEGSGQFKFALVNADGTTTYWSNDGTSSAGSEPSAAVALTVTKGLYSVLLGDATLANMTLVPATVFSHDDVRLRVWFNDGTHGSQLLTPDQRIAAVGYATMAAGVPNGAVTSSMIASGAVGSTQLGSGLTLGGTTSGTFSGNLAGNATTATSATSATTAGSFTGALAGNVTGTQGATVVAAVGGVTAANVASGANFANAATNANTPGTIVKRDASGNFSAGSITAAGSLILPATDSSGNVGVIIQNGTALIHTYGGSGNFFAGYGAGNFTTAGCNNTASGYNALHSNTGGFDPLHNPPDLNRGWSNTASGYSALAANTTGSSNTASGSYSLESNTTGDDNIATGSLALGSNTTGSQNVATGFFAMLSNTTGWRNTAYGSYALVGNSAGSQNTACGWSALEYNATGSFNTALGNGAGGQISTGSNNIALGSGAGSLLTSGDNNIDIGSAGIAGEANTIRVGTAQTSTFIAGISGATSSGGAAVFVNASGQLGTLTSSRRFKQNIADMNAASETILSLRPVTFQYKPEIDSKGVPQFGLIAEEVNELNPDLVVRDDKGMIQTVRYEQVNAMLLNEFLKDHRRAEAKDVEIGELKKRLAEIQAKDKESEARIARLESLLPLAPAMAALKTGFTRDN